MDISLQRVDDFKYLLWQLQCFQNIITPYVFIKWPWAYFENNTFVFYCQEVKPISYNKKKIQAFVYYYFPFIPCNDLL